MKKRSLQLLAAGSMLAAGQALAVNIGGLNIPLGASFAAGQFYTSIPTTPGQELSGYGKIDSFRSDAVADLCGGCELTYVFEDYQLARLDGATAYFTGGVVRIYMDPLTGGTQKFSLNDPGSSPADDLLEVADGDLWLTLRGHALDADGTTFRGVQTNIGSAVFTANGEGLLDVDTVGGGTATTFFDSNSVATTFGGGPADFYFATTFNAINQPYPGVFQGSMDLTTTAVPEPETYALMLSALGLIGLVAHRRRRV